MAFTPTERLFAKVGSYVAFIIVFVGIYKERYFYAAMAAVAGLLLLWAQTPEDE